MLTMSYFHILLVYWSVLWDHGNSETIACGNTVLPSIASAGKCQAWYDQMKCDNESILLRVGHCMTHSEDEGTYAMECPYFQLEGHDVLVQQSIEYIKLPNNVSELNDVMCGPMNRKGLLCKDCVDGFGPSITSVGFRCSNCTGMGYGIPLYLLQHFLPITLFYLIILVFRIHLASAPMTCLILYCQIAGINIAMNPQAPKYELLNGLMFKVNVFFYGIWNLEFFEYILPPFCVSRKLQLIHIVFLNLLSSIYPFVLIIITWICIQLHDRNFRLFVVMWRPFHKLFVKLRKAWNTRRDMIDVFTSFFLLSFSNVAFNTLIILQCRRTTRLDKDGNVTCQFLMAYNPSITCVSNDAKYVLIAILAFLGSLMFNILPALLLSLYPVKAFRMCLSKCKLDRLALVMFIEKFHGCYKDGLNGGRDLRSFSGLYFILRVIVPLAITVNTHTMGDYAISFLFYTFLFLALVTAFVRPYKRTYMNVFDIFLLVNLAILSHFSLRGNFRSKVIQLMALTTLPTILFGCLAIYNIFVILKIKQRLSTLWKLCLNCCSEQFVHRGHYKVVENEYTMPESTESIEDKGQVLVPTTSIIDIKTYDHES